MYCGFGVFVGLVGLGMMLCRRNIVLFFCMKVGWLLLVLYFGFLVQGWQGLECCFLILLKWQQVSVLVRLCCGLIFQVVFNCVLYIYLLLLFFLLKLFDEVVFELYFMGNVLIVLNSEILWFSGWLKIVVMLLKLRLLEYNRLVDRNGLVICLLVRFRCLLGFQVRQFWLSQRFFLLKLLLRVWVVDIGLLFELVLMWMLVFQFFDSVVLRLKCVCRCSRLLWFLWVLSSGGRFELVFGLMLQGLLLLSLVKLVIWLLLLLLKECDLQCRCMLLLKLMCEVQFGKVLGCVQFFVLVWVIILVFILLWIWLCIICGIQGMWIFLGIVVMVVVGVMVWCVCWVCNVLVLVCLISVLVCFFFNMFCCINRWIRLIVVFFEGVGGWVCVWLVSVVSMMFIFSVSWFIFVFICVWFLRFFKVVVCWKLFWVGVFLFWLFVLQGDVYWQGQ